MAQPPIGVVVVNWNGYTDTVACVESLCAAEPGPARIVVVDNGSTDGSAARLAQWTERRGAAAPAVRVLASATNRGFAAGCNLGLAALAADDAIAYFLLLNNDATVRADFFAALGRALAAFPAAAIVGATIFEAGPGGKVWYAGGRFVPLRALAAHRRRVPDGALAVPTDFVTGCAMLIARRAWAALGPLPESYFMYLEDAEYSQRARAAGFEVLYAPQAVAYHAVGSTVRRAVPPRQVAFWMTRSRALFLRRNARGWRRWAGLIYLALTKPARALAEVLTGHPSLGRAYLRGAIEGLLSEDPGRVAGHGPAAQGADQGVVAVQAPGERDRRPG